MGKFVAKEVTVRELEWGTIAFLDGHRIEMCYGMYSVMFHRFYAPLGDYRRDWTPFRKELWRKQNITPGEVFSLANKFDIQHVTKLKGGEKQWQMS